jgi:catechol 2,3-dioxygenase-like lactoylglutathione lyase family enzyme
MTTSNYGCGCRSGEQTTHSSAMRGSRHPIRAYSHKPEDPAMLHDHTDLRVSNIAKVQPLYDALLPALGYTRVTGDGKVERCYHPPGENVDFFGLTADPDHQANGTRIAFRGSTREEVNRLAEIARSAGAQQFEAPHECTEYTPPYYATFFEDADGNKFEICVRH